MIIKDFTAEYAEQAVRIALQNYEDERAFVPALPSIDAVPKAMLCEENRLGVAAFEGDTMLGFLCATSPFDNAFRSTDATGVFSPMGANGARKQNRGNIYARLYEAAAEKWVRAGAASHGIALYAHDKEAQEQLFLYGFGLRCMDAIREMKEISARACEGYAFSELLPGAFAEILPLEHGLEGHAAMSPTFMLRPLETQESFVQKARQANAVCFVARYEGRAVAYIRAEHTGETFIQHTPGYLHVNGAFCVPEHRGKGLHQKLLGLLTQKLRTKGYQRLGVDFESINPAAHGFWRKHFDIYTHGVVRRIDEHAVANRRA